MRNHLAQANVWTGQSSSTPLKTPYSGKTTEEMLLSLWGILTFIFFVMTLRINRALQTLFFSLAVLFFLLAGGVRNELCNKVGGGPSPAHSPWHARRCLPGVPLLPAAQPSKWLGGQICQPVHVLTSRWLRVRFRSPAGWASGSPW